VQLAAAATGGAAFLLSQAQSLAPGLASRLFAAIQRPWPFPLDWPARAATGCLLPLAAMTAMAAAAAWAAALGGARHLAAASDGGATMTAARTTIVRFRAGLTRIIVGKELRLIARDPELITQVALRLIYVIPLAALLVRGRHGVDPGPAIAGGATAFAGLLASSLAWIIVAAEDAPDLLAAAPRDAAAIARAKLVAAVLVPLALLGVAALAAAVAAGARAAGVTLAIGAVAAVTAAQLQAWFGRPAPRAAFRRRQAGSFVVALGEVVLAGAWSGTASLLVGGSWWAAVPAVIGGAIMAGAIEARDKRSPR
jgi:ABC-2 type transport system permease protein